MSDKATKESLTLGEVDAIRTTILEGVKTRAIQDPLGMTKSLIDCLKLLAQSGDQAH